VLAAHEPVGVDHLRALARDLYGEGDPAAILHQAAFLEVRRSGDEWILELPLPLVGHDDLDVARHEDDLLVRVGPYRRALLLPDSLCRRPVREAALVDGVLRVTFGPRASA
jgi:arsenite-transporting ATPase